MVADVDVTGLTKAIDGQVLTPHDPGFDEARALWNGAIDRTPMVIARCVSASEVAEAIGFARSNDLTIAVRSGGHNVAGTGTVDDGLLIDLSPMRDVRVDPGASLAVVAGGATLGDLDSATQAHGLATSMGVVSETGVAGLTLTGGMGWLRRRTGLSCDELVAAEVVTADGTIVTANEDENADLFWGLRGGGGNFGVVTSFTFRLHPVGPEVAVAFTLYPAEDAVAVYGSCDAFVAGAPEEISPLGFLGRVPADEAFPAETHGKPFAAVAAVHTGTDVARGERELQPLRELGDPLVDMSGTMPYADAQSLLDEEYPSGRRYYWKSIELSVPGARGDRTADAIGGRRTFGPVHGRHLVPGRRDEPRLVRGDRVRRPQRAHLDRRRGELGRGRDRRGQHRVGPRVHR